MYVIVKNGAIDKHQMVKQIAKPAALEQTRKMYESEERKATDPWYRTRVDTAEAAKNAKLYKRNYENILPETLNSNVKDAMWRRAKQLKDEFIVGMLSKEELHPIKGFKVDGTMKWVVDEEKMRTLRSVERNTQWYQQNTQKISEFKNIMRHLCPEDSNAGDIEKFRPRLKNIH